MKRNNSKKVRVEPTRRPKKNPLKARGIEAVDYKDIETLRTFISERGKIRSRRVTGNCVQHQRDVAIADDAEVEVGSLHGFLLVARWGRSVGDACTASHSDHVAARSQSCTAATSAPTSR